MTHQPDPSDTTKARELAEAYAYSWRDDDFLDMRIEAFLAGFAAGQAAERDHGDMTTAYMVGYAKGKDELSERNSLLTVELNATNALVQLQLENCEDLKAEVLRLTETLEHDTNKIEAAYIGEIDALKRILADEKANHCEAVNLLRGLETQLACTQQERDKWKDEYDNLCKFATDYEEQRDALKSEVTRLGAEIENLMRVDYWQDRYKISQIEAVRLRKALDLVLYYVHGDATWESLKHQVDNILAGKSDDQT